MVPFIKSARELHAVPTPEAYRRKHAADVVAKTEAGMRYELHTVTDPVIARVNHGVWLIDCDCGNGAATDPNWGIACCFGCGAVFERVVFPDDWRAIEAALVGRPNAATRNWNSDETVADLTAETQRFLAERG